MTLPTFLSRLEELEKENWQAKIKQLVEDWYESREQVRALTFELDDVVKPYTSALPLLIRIIRIQQEAMELVDRQLDITILSDALAQVDRIVEGKK